MSFAANFAGSAFYYEPTKIVLRGYTWIRQYSANPTSLKFVLLVSILVRLRCSYNIIVNALCIPNFNVIFLNSTLVNSNNS
jgi:hypothetical protein